jgi:hypothetical protein
MKKEVALALGIVAILFLVMLFVFEIFIFRGPTLTGFTVVRDNCGGTDLNFDGKVDLDDFVIIKENFGCSGNCLGDVNQDGKVDLDDMAILKNNFGRTDCNGFMPNASCFNDDGGLNYFFAGKVVVNDTEIIFDECLNLVTLKENYCDGDIAKFVLYNCTYGCLDGQCLEKTVLESLEKETEEVAEELISKDFVDEIFYEHFIDDEIIEVEEILAIDETVCASGIKCSSMIRGYCINESLGCVEVTGYRCLNDSCVVSGSSVGCGFCSENCFKSDCLVKMGAPVSQKGFWERVVDFFVFWK